jgi:dTMP kinase
MRKNKIIVIEGTDCSGKKTQSEMLNKRLEEAGFKIEKFGFPVYTSPTGKIVGGPYLGKEYICESYFPEGAVDVDPKVAGLYYAADRRYHKNAIEKILENNNLILDRYVDSNTAHQAGKEKDKKKRHELYKWFSKFEYGMLQLPEPDIKILLYMPREFGIILKQNRPEAPDGLEKSEEHLKMAEDAYLEIAKYKHYKVINCVKNNAIRTIEDINQELFDYVSKQLKK